MGKRSRKHNHQDETDIENVENDPTRRQKKVLNHNFKLEHIKLKNMKCFFFVEAKTGHLAGG
jgi:hypothetical protein